jgi:iron(III) transport system substrate-binding protein
VEQRDVDSGRGRLDALSRRRMLGLLGAGAGLGVLAACRGSTPPPAPAPAVPAPPIEPAAVTGPRDLLSVQPKLATLEQELAVPDAIMEAARREGRVSIISSWDGTDIAKFLDAFKQRYPAIDVQYQEANEEVRTIRTLTELKAGRNRVDVITSIAGFMVEYKAANALLPLNDLPGTANYEFPLKDHDNEWLGYQIQMWGIGYNTETVRPADLPRTWDDLTDPKWRGRIGLANRPNLWLQAIWKEWGPERTTDFIRRLFANNPQRRREGLDAMANLLGAGEFDIAIPSSTSRIERTMKRGAPVGWTAADPLMVAPGDICILRGPNTNAAKVFVNWAISREGNQAFRQAIPDVMAHPAILSQRENLGVFADAIQGRQWSVRVPEDEHMYLPGVREVWNEYFLT